MINYVSNLPADLRTGGFSAMNAMALEVLQKRWPVHYAGPINPPARFWPKAVSKFLRATGGRGDFFFFSRARLSAIADEVTKSCRAEARADFFHGFTPWIATRPIRPYIAWSDCTFRDYVNVYHRPAQFSVGDVARIEAAEAAWMRGAAGLGFTSDWAARRATADYDLDPARVVVVGIFGEIALPAAEVYAGGREFAFISTNFEAKGGVVVLDALRRLRERHPDAGLTIVGDAPANIADHPGVKLAGFLHKEDPVENARLREILGTSRAVVHPTRSDIAPLLAVEAGYFGCPVISSRRFAIPEIVADGETGLLLNDPADSSALAQAMAWMLESGDAYAAMRRAAWNRSRRELSKARFERRLLDAVEAALAEPRR